MTPLELVTLIASGEPSNLKQASDYPDTLHCTGKTLIEPLCKALKESQSFGHDHFYRGPLHRKYPEITGKLQGYCAETETARR